MKTIITLIALLTFSSVGNSQYYNLSNDRGNSTEPEVVADNQGNVHFVWVDDTGGKSEIYYSIYATLTPASTIMRLGAISGSNDSCNHPRIAVNSSANIIYVVWEDNLGSGKVAIVCASFKNPILFVNSSIHRDTLSVGIDSSSYRPDIAVVHGVPFVCWVSNNGNGVPPFKGKLFFTRLDTATGNWTTPIVLADSVAIDAGAGNFWGRVTSAFNGTVFYENRLGMHTVKNLLGSTPDDVVSSGWLPYMQGMEVVSYGKADSEHVYALYHGDGLTCNCDEPLTYRMFDGNNWSDQTIIAYSQSESISWGGFSLAVISDSDMVAIYEKQQWNGTVIADTLVTLKFNGTQWVESKLLPNVAGLSEPSIATGVAGNLWMAFCGISDNGNTDVFVYGDPLTSVHETSGMSSQTDFYLTQNYPNPFNPTTQIKYSIPTNSFVTLKVYDALGREVETLVDEPQAAGYHEVKFDGSRLTSGVYFYRLTVGNYTSVKKLMLVK
ncbi:MAG: T9SS type A sorting domain-containing protein [Candidatus Kryptoniota bacterium]